MVKELTFTENGQTRTIPFGDRTLKYLEKHGVAMTDVDSVVGHDELIIVWPFPKEKWAEMIDSAKEMGILDSYNHLDRHVVVKNM